MDHKKILKRIIKALEKLPSAFHGRSVVVKPLSKLAHFYLLRLLRQLTLCSIIFARGVMEGALNKEGHLAPHTRLRASHGGNLKNVGDQRWLHSHS